LFLYCSSSGSADDELFERAVPERAFAVFGVETASPDWHLRAPDGDFYSAWMSVDTDPFLGCLSVNRPPSAPEFWNAMFEVLRQTRIYLFWPAPGRPSYCVANPDWRSYIKPDFVEDNGEPAMISSGAEISAAIDASFD